MTANPELCLIAVPVCTAFGQSGVKTRPFSPTLPVMDNLALFLMASEKVSWVAWKGNRKNVQCYNNSVSSAKYDTTNTKVSIIRHLHFFPYSFGQREKCLAWEREAQLQGRMSRSRVCGPACLGTHPKIIKQDFVQQIWVGHTF